MRHCRWADCWCKAWPPRRVVLSTGEHYTVQEVARESDTVALYRYAYTSAPGAEEGAPE